MLSSVISPELKTADKNSLYPEIHQALRAVLTGETDLIANLANIAAALKEQFQWLWVGFYLVKENELVVGPFQGPPACTRISKGRGVCGACWTQNKTISVPDVEKFPGHIACSSLSRSEIVIPINLRNEFVGLLDVDSEALSAFDSTDQRYLEQIVSFIKF